ncbi:Sec-independent protein translocase subunit TatA/TatB [Hymenobacter jeollabukensis]|uniref:Sec-independent protein translocase protein TatA n=1 Tax=Hymenobacter jeollabukensis TaxID=2025313 RepID=A0A5R8WSX3_9BACT|nr:twin-arginine translocase TatA/TatE family subunit [Hymenobacter jeollabukensis]TLM94283.1 twin-arginine translocase TatA/TatE family subunit [Hymenobacter jeollabukensis]
MHTPFLLFLEGIGGGELAVIVLFILVFFGANKIPELARGLGKGIREFKDASREIRSEIENAGQTGFQPNNGYQQPAAPQQSYQPVPPAPAAYQPTGLDQPTADYQAPTAAPEQPTVTPAGLPHESNTSAKSI